MKFELQKCVCVIFLGLAFAVSGVTAQTLAETELVRGKLVEKVLIKDDPSQSYALYLPTTYDPSKKYPAVYLFDPGGRGAGAVEKYRAAAETYGYLLFGSNNSRNGIDLRLLSTVLNNLWTDTNRRFSIDPTRALAAGLSGGARVASLFANSCKGCIFGVIGSAAGFSPDIEVTEKLQFLFFGTVGYDDVDFVEFRELEKKLTAAHIAHRIEEFDGGHQWLDESLAAEALAWFEIRAMKTGRRTKDDRMIEEHYQEGVARADRYLNEKMPIEAYASLAAIVDDFSGWRDVSATAEKARSVASSTDYKRAQRAETDQFAAQQKAVDEINSLMANVGDLSSDANPKVTIREKIASLHKKADAAVDGPERRVARRTLNQLSIGSGEAANSIYERKGDLAHALDILELAALTNPKSPQPHYNRARIFGLLGKKSDALGELKKAIELGFKDLDRIRSEKAFEILAKDDQFIKLLANSK